MTNHDDIPVLHRIGEQLVAAIRDPARGPRGRRRAAVVVPVAVAIVAAAIVAVALVGARPSGSHRIVVGGSLAGTGASAGGAAPNGSSTPGSRAGASSTRSGGGIAAGTQSQTTPAAGSPGPGGTATAGSTTTTAGGSTTPPTAPKASTPATSAPATSATTTHTTTAPPANAQTVVLTSANNHGSITVALGSTIEVRLTGSTDPASQTTTVWDAPGSTNPGVLSQQGGVPSSEGGGTASAQFRAAGIGSAQIQDGYRYACPKGTACPGLVVSNAWWVDVTVVG